MVTKVIAENLHIDKLTVLDGGDGEGLSNYVKNLTRSAVVMLEQMKNATGVDLAELASGGGGSAGAALPKELGSRGRTRPPRRSHPTYRRERRGQRTGIEFSSKFLAIRNAGPLCTLRF